MERFVDKGEMTDEGSRKESEENRIDGGVVGQLLGMSQPSM